MAYNTKLVNTGLWSRDFLLIILANLATYMAFYMLLPTLPMYITLISGSSALSGLSMGVLLISAILIRPFAGKALDSSGRKGVYFCGLLIFLFTAVAFNLVHTLFWVLLFRFLQGFGWGATNTASGTVAADVIPRHRLAEAISRKSFALYLNSFIIKLYLPKNCTFH